MLTVWSRFHFWTNERWPTDDDVAAEADSCQRFSIQLLRRNDDGERTKCNIQTLTAVLGQRKSRERLGCAAKKTSDIKRYWKTGLSSALAELRGLVGWQSFFCCDLTVGPFFETHLYTYRNGLHGKDIFYWQTRRGERNEQDRMLWWGKGYAWDGTECVRMRIGPARNCTEGKWFRGCKNFPLTKRVK